MQNKDLLFTQFSVFPTLLQVVFALEQKFLLNSGPAMKSCSCIYDISRFYGSGVKKFLFYYCLKGIIQYVPDQKHWDLGMCL